MMADLRRFTNSEVAGLAGALQEDIDSAAFPEDVVFAHVDALKFRDEAGDYWTLGLRSRRWYRNERGTWTISAAEPSGLEGPVSLGGQVAARPESRRGERPPAETDPSKGLPALVSRARNAYEGGEITSDGAESLVSDTYALDRSGRFWTVGFRSGGWYRFEGGRWSPSSGPPPRESLISDEYEVRDCPSCDSVVPYGMFCGTCGARLPERPDPSEALEASVVDFLTSDATLPEPVVDPWQPPSGYPEPASTTAPAPGAGEAGQR